MVHIGSFQVYEKKLNYSLSRIFSKTETVSLFMSDLDNEMRHLGQSCNASMFEQVLCSDLKKMNFNQQRCSSGINICQKKTIILKI